MIPFNRPYLTGKETHYIYEAVNSGKLSGNGMFSKRCQSFFENEYGFKKCLLTTSCTDALEMAAILCGIEFGDEVIIPSYTFVSTALAFVRQGAKIIFADSMSNHPNIDVDTIEALITSRTKVIVPVHYAGVACDMTKLMALADKYGLLVVEDAAQAIDSFYTKPINISGNQKKSALGSIGHFGCFSFHETKNIISGEGGMLAINDERFIERAEVIWEKGTNRAQFFRGEINKYGWVDIGSSFLPSEVIAAFLWAQIENMSLIQGRRIEIWNRYYEGLKALASNNQILLPTDLGYSTNNAHMFYLICPSIFIRTRLIDFLKTNDVFSVFHYISLHDSLYYKEKHDGRVLKNCDMFSDCLIRLPMYNELTNEEIDFVVSKVYEFFVETQQI